MRFEFSKTESLLILKSLSKVISDPESNPIDKAMSDKLAEKIKSQVMFDFVMLKTDI